MRGRETPLLPVEDAREAALFFVVAALCFLAALAALSAKSTYGAARAWTAEVEGELTVTLQDVDRRAAEEARSNGRGEQVADAEATSALAKDGDLVAVAAEVVDVLLDPPQRRDLISYAAARSVLISARWILVRWRC